jgi:hypothetical protein
MKLLSREAFARHENGRPVATGFVCYVSPDQPILMHCAGREDYSDGYDDYAVSLSRDNGRSWSEPRTLLKSYTVPEGRIRYAEAAAWFDPDARRLLVISDKVLYPNDALDVDAVYSLVLDTYDADADAWLPQQPVDVSPGRSIAVSFSFPIRVRSGRLLVPAMRQQLGDDGRAMHFPGCWAPMDEAITLIGDPQPGGGFSWRLGQPVRIDPQVSSRGLDENALAELSDGRIAMVCRGDNSMFPERPGYKWLCLSSDDGATWSAPVPFPCEAGEPIESGANGSAFFRSIRTGKLYWIGNLCIHGVRPRGNWPRTPLVVCEVREDPVAIRRDTITVIDQQRPGEPPEVQHSNFRFYQDRETGDLVLFLTRYGERSAEQWMLADYYRYRIAID